MPILDYEDSKYSKIFFNGDTEDESIKKVYINDELVFSSGQPVTYMVDTNVKYTEEVLEGASCLSPKTFTPTKIGWTFVGWREDKTANGNVLTNKVMGDASVTLYAVFKQTVVLTMYNNSTTATKQNLTKYYNNGSEKVPEYVAVQATKSGWNVRGWSSTSGAQDNISYPNSSYIHVSGNMTIYGCYTQNVTLSFWDGAKTVTQAYTRMYNSSGKTFNPTVAIWQVAVSGWNYIGFTTSSAANGSITHQNGAVITMDGNKTFYARYNRTLTCRFDGGGATGGGTATASGVQDRGANGAATSVRITMPQCGYSRSDHSFRGWSYGSQVLQPGTAITITDSTYATATWLQTVYRYNNAGNFAQVLTCPISANYRMEVWGAKGADRSGGGTGGYGGYAVGTQYLPAGTVLYIVVGGAGTITGGGYNGGGNGGSGNGGGGGATHIGLHNKLLRDYGNTSGLYIVAGGGGGGGSTHLNNNSSKGGSGGGANGETGFNYLNEQKPESGSGEGGTQTKAGRGGSFGQGGHADQFGGGGGGGGLYGGGCGANYNGGAGGGGGSGYIGGVVNGSMAHWQNNGAGRAVITIL